MNSRNLCSCNCSSSFAESRSARSISFKMASVGCPLRSSCSGKIKFQTSQRCIVFLQTRVVTCAGALDRPDTPYTSYKARLTSGQLHFCATTGPSVDNLAASDGEARSCSMDWANACQLPGSDNNALLP